MTTVEPEPRAMRQLSRQEALRRLGSAPMGRLVFTDRALPAIRPVNHLLDGEQVIIRSQAGAAISVAAERGVVVAYQADAIDPVAHLGWSVVVTGVARIVADPVAAGHYRSRLRPWVDREMDRVITVGADLVTGFVLEAAADDWARGSVERSNGSAPG
ncbi:pyridoxamine 5'-phosphate oxidase family protein [Natronosporangium hydrolyticum]|uniref:Pyridoxamine 5'-phosphate oxidase family protein n=1 Tax=Natronosporangium hydrolyticum TaxID=2811111 RepID=A0A895YHK4_9ACTN|nr:pyridoxamine 5'-phosphate oxidase family protein [Natronosporangium hydrolyticum]QSB13208.1 pyridoxamine 5'-phosphate oxidase family protein [Natronosporangium hydrolyticum]